MKKVPNFKNQKEEIEFWDTHESLDYFDKKSAQVVKFSNLKKSTKTISIRLPEDMLEKIKTRANSIDVPYQSYIKMLLKKELDEVI